MGFVVIMLIFFGGFFVYFLPSWIAASEKHVRTGSIMVVNIFLGWTLVGWVVAMAWACDKTQYERNRSGQGSDGVELVAIRSGLGSDERKCPYCAEMIKSEAKICRFCKSEVTPLKAAMVPADRVSCPTCSKLNDHHRKDCMYCGAALHWQPGIS